MTSLGKTKEEVMEEEEEQEEDMLGVQRNPGEANLSLG